MSIWSDSRRLRPQANMTSQVNWRTWLLIRRYRGCKQAVRDVTSKPTWVSQCGRSCPRFSTPTLCLCSCDFGSKIMMTTSFVRGSKATFCFWIRGTFRAVTWPGRMVTVTFETLHPVVSAFRCVFDRSLLTQCGDNSCFYYSGSHGRGGGGGDTGLLLHDT